MPSESKSLLTVKREEKPNHYSYLKEFRVEQCSLFLQHKCTQHRPFTCFHWHFNNQRRRRPIRKRDGTFNYSADNYCSKYDETTGNCPDGDDCPFLHRTNGDTERRYHLRYYKTAMCVHDTDARGYCVKNGPHCAFAHGSDDLRPPVYDVKEMQASENSSGENGANNGPNALDKERNLMNEDPKWQDTNYVLTCYKTVPCQRPPRLCRQGYACPAYHNSRDKRRNPRKYIYRSTPCPNVKHGDEWGEPSNCESGDSCTYCHTRTEQQFHPEIYKSTKCNDVQSAGYCPRGVFCAFAHLDQEMSIARDMDIGTVNLADILSSAMPSSNREDNGESNDMRDDLLTTLDNEISQFSAETNKTSLFMAPSPPQNHNPTLLSSVQFSGLDPDTLDSVMGGAFEELNMEEPLGLAAMDRDYDADSPTISNSISAGLASSGLLGSGSAPVAIPGSDNMARVLGSYSPSTASPLHHLSSGYLSSIFSHPETSIDSGSLLNQLGGSVGSSKFGSSFTNGIMSPGRAPHPIANSPLINSFPVSPSLTTNNLMVEQMVRLREAAESQRFKCDEQVNHSREACNMCNIQLRELEEANRKATIAEKRRDEAINQAKALQKEVDLLQGGPYLHGIRRVSELKTLPLTTLRSIQAQLKTDLEQVDKELQMQTGQKCMVCEERNRSVTLGPCNHYVLCAACAPDQRDCPYCKTPIVAHSNPSNASVLHA